MAGSCRRYWFVWLLVALAAGGARSHAEEKKPAATPPPKPVVSLPLGLLAGRTNQIVLRGVGLKNAQSVTLTGNTAPLPVMIRKREDAKLPDGITAARAGDQSLELEVWIPTGWTNAPLRSWKVEGTNGVGILAGIPVLAADQWVEAKEPNDGFREAQPLKPGQGVRGVMEKAGEVDVYRIEIDAHSRLHAEIRASRLGSTLDAILTLYDERGTILGSNDDTFGADPSLDHATEGREVLFLAVTYANEKPAKTHAYLLSVEAKP